MKKRIINKLIIALLIISIFFTLIASSKSQATNLQETDSKLTENLDNKEKIMKYNIVTNETTEVNIEELREKFNINQDNTYSINSSSSYGLYSQSDLTKISNLQESVLSKSVTLDKVNDTSKYPNVMVCKTVGKNYNKGYEAHGTASIIAPHVAITAAHCIWDPNDDNYQYRDWVVNPGMNGGTYYGTECGWVNVYYSSKWKETHSAEYDWAICELGYNVGNEIGWLRSDMLSF